MSNKSGTSSQVITLPSGGGALQGIGETFSPNLFTGTGNFTVPIALPSGRNGFQPQLSLSYSTGNGNGPFGLGWLLSVPEVTRKSSKGVPRYRDNATDVSEWDTLILSGAEDLVPISEPVPGAPRLFKPRTEGLFALIERMRTPGEDFWRVNSKDGLVSLYGKPLAEGGDPAVVANPARTKIFCWKLSQTTDPFGNRINYHYLRDQGSDEEHTWDQLYLQKVEYVDYAENGQTRFLVSVTFSYEDRPDKFSNYRAGFEIRTRKRCKRIEIRTHAEHERLNRNIELIYLDERVDAGELPGSILPRNGVSLLSQIRVIGHDDEQPIEVNRTEELPPLEFGYTRFEPAQSFKPIAGEGNFLPGRSLANDEFEMVGLFGNGLPDIVQMNGAVQYWRNLGNGALDIPRTMNEVPAGVHLADPGVQFADMNGDGRADLLVLSKQGYFPLNFQGQWSPHGFVHYASSPSVNFFGDNNVRLIDLDGDGVIDALRTDSDFVLYFNNPITGWNSTPETRSPPEDFPNLGFADARVKLADLNGDNLQDIVVVERGTIDYWPYLGYGKWGRRIQTSFSTSDLLLPGNTFEPRQVLFGDVDGDGLDDLIYVQTGRVTIWINQNGESWNGPINIDHNLTLTDVNAVRLTDMLGTGTAGLLWTFDQTGQDSNYRFLDLTGGVKPYLLEQMNNHMGAVTRVQYAPSTKSYLADFDKPATRWKTPLPFPVQVVDRVEVIDEVSRGKLTTSYRYHHGYWDGTEREFRGFGMVEQLDTETFEAYHSSGPLDAQPVFESVAEKYFSMPLLTKTWFHLGPVVEDFGQLQELDWSDDYWQGDAQALAHADGVKAFLQTLTSRKAKRDALRTLRGSVLRTELYALDDSPLKDRPYTVTEHSYGLREESNPAIGNNQRQRIFFPHPLAQRTTQWERGDEPMTQFAFTDDYDEFGQSRLQVSLAVPRYRDYSQTAPPGTPYLGTVTKTQYARPEALQPYIVNRVWKTASFEVSNDGSQTILDLHSAIKANALQLNLIAQSFNYFDGEAFVGLPQGRIGNYGALVRSESLITTEKILREVYRDPSNSGEPDIPCYLQPDGTSNWPEEYPQEFQDNAPSLAGYTFADGSDHRARGYFAQTSSIEFDFHLDEVPRRGLAVASRDPFGNINKTSYDQYRLLAVNVTDAAGLTIDAEHDYRVLQPCLTRDANKNCRMVTFSPLGLVKTLSVRGKEGNNEGDSIEPGTRFAYNLFNFMVHGKPAFVRSIVRQHHVTETDVPLPQRDETIITVEYSDGFGRALQTRTQAEDVLFGDSIFGAGVLPVDQDILNEDAIGALRNDVTERPNVILSGWQVYDNKGRVVEKYEPFFGVGWDYDKPGDAQRGQKVTMFYDPRGRISRTVNPDGSEQRVIYGVPRDLRDPDPDRFDGTPWEVFTYDANDLAPLSKRPDGTSLRDEAPEAHHFTPASVVVDALGRTIESIARNAVESQNSPPQIQEIRTQSTYDIRGNLLTVTDALNRAAFTYAYDLANRPWRIDSIDAGLRRIVLDVTGNELERRDSKGALTLQSYDLLQRPIRHWGRDDKGGRLSLRQRMEYGDGGDPNQPDREAMRARNLLGQLYRHHDEAGLTTVEIVDFKGNVLDKTRRVIADGPILGVFNEASANGWQVKPFQVDWEPSQGQDLQQLEGELLEALGYRTTSSVDALNRIKRMLFPEDVEGRRRELKPEYNQAGGLESVWLDQTLYLERIAYDAKGQRTLIAYGNGVMTRYAYDAQTFRLKRLRSERYSKANKLSYHATGEVFQEFGYDYDLVGNMTAIRDRTPGSGILNNPEAGSISDPALAQLMVSGNALHRRFNYDAIYRLCFASGRESDVAPEGPPWQSELRGTDLTKARAYTENYHYDLMGNMLRLEHGNGQGGGLVRKFTMEANNNRLRDMQVGDSIYHYDFDTNGNMLSETTSRHFEWNHADQLKVFRTQTEGAEPSVYAHYLYDTAGQRLKKLVRKQNGAFEVTHYVDGVFEHHRWRAQSQAGENNHVHMIDDSQRIALVRVGPAHPSDGGPDTQFQLADHLGSSNLVIDLVGAFTSREEFTPYGETSFGSFAKKRYRFGGMERDEESGVFYVGARYFASFTTRWISCDPAGPIDGNNLYCYARCSPMTFIDSSGLDSQPVVPGVVEGVNDQAEATEESDPNLSWHEQKGTWMLNDADTGAWLKWQDESWLDDAGWVEDPSEYITMEGVAPTLEDDAWYHTVLDFAGMVPFVGEAADLLNAGIYAAEGDYKNAALSAGGAIPFLGNAVTGAKAAKKAANLIDSAGGVAKSSFKSVDEVVDSASHVIPDTGLNRRLIRPEELVTKKITVPSRGRGVNDELREWAGDVARRQKNNGPIDVAHIEPHVFTQPGQTVLVRPQSRPVNRGEGASIAKAADRRRRHNASQPDKSKHYPVRRKGK